MIKTNHIHPVADSAKSFSWEDLKEFCRCLEVETIDVIASDGRIPRELSTSSGLIQLLDYLIKKDLPQPLAPDKTKTLTSKDSSIRDFLIANRTSQ